MNTCYRVLALIRPLLNPWLLVHLRILLLVEESTKMNSLLWDQAHIRFASLTPAHSFLSFMSCVYMLRYRSKFLLVPQHILCKFCCVSLTLYVRACVRVVILPLSFPNNRGDITTMAPKVLPPVSSTHLSNSLSPPSPSRESECLLSVHSLGPGAYNAGDVNTGPRGAAYSISGRHELKFIQTLL